MGRNARPLSGHVWETRRCPCLMPTFRRNGPGTGGPPQNRRRSRGRGDRLRRPLGAGARPRQGSKMRSLVYPGAAGGGRRGHGAPMRIFFTWVGKTGVANRRPGPWWTRGTMARRLRSVIESSWVVAGQCPHGPTSLATGYAAQNPFWRRAASDHRVPVAGRIGQSVTPRVPGCRSRRAVVRSCRRWFRKPREEASRRVMRETCSALFAYTRGSTGRGYLSRPFPLTSTRRHGNFWIGIAARLGCRAAEHFIFIPPGDTERWRSRNPS
mmetsp:Transcript_34778/g.98127  ORF Transcript_34778/g.98127 Transcript_34778/m.98127 type:complete len:268 (-) Transcript_34778:139-942(-)